MKRPGWLLMLALLVPGTGRTQSVDTTNAPEAVLRGTVVEIQGDTTMPHPLWIRVRTRNGDTVWVNLAPHGYLRSRVQLRVGDEVEIRGERTRTKRGEVVMAHVMEQVRTRTRIQLRDEQGFPLWMSPHRHGMMQGERGQGPMYNRNREFSLEGKVVDLKMITPPRGFYPHLELIVRTPSGNTHQVVLGPSWFVENQIRVGDSVRIVGSPMRWGEQQVVMARLMENLRNQHRFALRDSLGMPLWRHAMMRQGSMGGPGGGMGGPMHGPVEGNTMGPGGMHGGQGQ